MQPPQRPTPYCSAQSSCMYTLLPVEHAHVLPHRPECGVWLLSLQSQYVEGVQPLQQLGVIRQVVGICATVLYHTTQQLMYLDGHCSRKRGGGGGRAGELESELKHLSR